MVAFGGQGESDDEKKTKQNKDNTSYISSEITSKMIWTDPGAAFEQKQGKSTVCSSLKQWDRKIFQAADEEVNVY